MKKSEAPRGKPRGIFAEPCEAKNAIHPCGKPQGFLAKKGKIWFYLFLLLIAITVLLFVRSRSMPERVALLVDMPVKELGPNWPMYCGVPFPRGSLRNAQRARVVDGKGNTVPSQSRTMARWTGSDDVRWLGVDFLGDPAKTYFLEFGPKLPGLNKTGGAPGIVLEREGSAVIITTGPARFVAPAAGPLISRAWFDLNADGRFTDDELILRADEGELYVTDQAGRTAVSGADAEPDGMEVEPDAEVLRTQGKPLHVAIRREGWYTTSQDKDRLARHITRLHFYAGQSFVRLEHTLVLSRNTNPTAHVSRYTKEPPIWFRDVGIRFNHALAGARDVTFAEDGEQPDNVMRARLEPADRGLFMFQEKAFYFSRMDPQADCRFVIGRDTATGTEVLKEGSRCGDWTDVRNARAGVSLVLRDLWQQYPKELNVTSNAITARLWSNRGERELDFRFETMLKQWPTNWLNHELHGDYGDAYNALMTQGSNNYYYALGLAKTHELLLYLHPGAADAAEIEKTAQAFSRPVIVLADPQWLYHSEAMGPIYPRDTNQFPLAEAFMENYFDSYMKIIRSWGDYGFIDYGAGPHVWYRLGKKGQSLEGRWFPYLYRYSGIIDYGFHAHLWRMYARSGQRKYLDYAEETNRQRMDINMVHWDRPGVSYSRVNGWMIGKYRGAFSCTVSLINWPPFCVLHHNSGTDLRQLYWFYYLRDYRRAHDVAEEYHALVKKLWEGGAHGPFTGTRPFATLKNLGTLYQETGDPKILEIGRERLAALVDLESPQGVSPKEEATGMGKYTTKIGAVERWYEATGDELAKKALLRGAETYARTSMGNIPFSYYNVMARVLNRAYRITGNALYARTLQRNMDLAIAIYYAGAGQWKNMLGDGVSAAGSAYPLGDMAIGMDAITRVGIALDPTPILQQAGQGRPVLAIFHKPANREVVLDVRGCVPLQPRVLTLSGETVKGILYEPFRENLYSLEKSDNSHFYYVRLPAALPEGDFILDAGIGGAPWEVTWTDAPKIVFYAPGGISVGCGGTWKGRFAPGATQEAAPATWRFMVPKGTQQFELYCSDTDTIDLRRPDGTQVALNETQKWSTVTVPPEQAGKLWRFIAHNAAFVELRGVPPLLTGSDDRFFLPATDRIPVQSFGLERDYRFTTEPAIPGDARYAPGALLGKNPGQALVLRGRRTFNMPRGKKLGEGRYENFNAGQGTLEFWFLPDWSDVYEPGAESAEKYVLMSKPWYITLHDDGLPKNLFRIYDPKGSLYGQSGLTLERGRWTHLAWQWHEEDGRFAIETYVDGRLKNTTYAEKDWKPPGPEGNLGFSYSRSPLNGAMDELRISGKRRYTGDFKPRREQPLTADSGTLALFHFDGNTEGISGDGRTVPAKLVE